MEFLPIYDEALGVLVTGNPLAPYLYPGTPVLGPVAYSADVVAHQAVNQAVVDHVTVPSTLPWIVGAVGAGALAWWLL
jgi:hypothetical protein